MEKSKLKQAVELLDQANYELTGAFENNGMDEYDYDVAILFAGKLINRARKIILATNDEIKEILQ